MVREPTLWPIATIYECTHRGELIRLSVTRFEKDGKAKGVPYAELRGFYRDGDEWRHGKGRTIPVERLVELHKALGQYLAQLPPEASESRH